MAATAVYARLAPVLFNGSADSPPAFANISATTNPFTITSPGLYCATVKGSTFGTVALQQLLADDTTYAAVTILTGTATVTAGTVQGAAAAFSADGTGLVYLSAGQYRWALA